MDQTATDTTATEYQRLKLDSWHEEILLLAHIVRDPTLVRRVAQQLTTKHLFRSDCVPTIFDELIKISSTFDGHMTRDDILTVIRPIMSDFPTSNDEFFQAVKDAASDTRDGAYYLRRVIDRAGRRMIWSDMQPREVLSQTYNVSEAIGSLRETMLRIGKQFSTATGRGGLLRNDYHENLKRLHERLDPANQTHLTFGYPRFDSMIKFESSSYNIIGARPSIGKTAVSINLALQLAEQGIRTMFITLEVSYDKLLELMACRLDHLKKSLVHNSASQNTRSRLSDSFEKLHGLPIEMHSNCSDVSQIITIIEDAITRDRDPVKAVFVDYAQIIRVRQKTLNDLQRLNIISEAFRAVKSDHEIALFLAAQLNRKATESKAPRLEDLKGSGDFEQDADTVLLLDRPNKELAEREAATPGMERTVEDDQLDVYVRKNRFGGTGKISFHWDGSLGKIEEMKIGERNNQPRKRDDERSHDYQTPDRMQRSYSDGSMDTGDAMPF